MQKKKVLSLELRGDGILILRGDGILILILIIISMNVSSITTVYKILQFNALHNCHQHL